MKLTWYKKAFLLFAAPIIIGAWCVMNPRAVWAEAKKEWNK